MAVGSGLGGLAIKGKPAIESHHQYFLVAECANGVGVASVDKHSSLLRCMSCPP